MNHEIVLKSKTKRAEEISKRLDELLYQEAIVEEVMEYFSRIDSDIKIMKDISTNPERPDYLNENLGRRVDKIEGKMSQIRKTLGIYYVHTK